MKRINQLLIALLLIGTSGRAQQWTFGPNVRLPLSLNTTTATVSVNAGPNGRTELSLGEVGETTPAQWSAFARYDRNRFFAQGELTAGRFDLGGYVNDERGNGFSFRTESRLLGATVRVGVKPLPWLRLYGGGGYGHHAWRNGYFKEQADRLERRIAQGGINGVPNPNDPGELRSYRLLEALGNAYRSNVLTGQLGLGVDIGGLMLDLSYQQSLTPLLDGIPTTGGALPVRQHYGSYVLALGYRLFPLKAHLLAQRRRNPAYERIKRDIPFYRNEFHLALGLLGEDIGSAFIYENRYTRYVSRRLGLAGGLNVMRTYETFENGFLPSHYTAVQLLTGVRVLPLYSRRHTIGLTAGPTLNYESGVSASSGGSRTTETGFSYDFVNWRADSRRGGLSVSWQATLDYHFAATDRLIVGPWLRINGLDYGAFGIQTGYRF